MSFTKRKSMIRGHFRTNSYSFAARATAAFIVVITAATLVLRVSIKASETSNLSDALSYLSQFFTILTNVLVLVSMVAVTLGVSVAPRFVMALTTAIIGASLVYYVVLSDLVELSRLGLIADHGVHAIVPALTVLWWLLFSPKVQLSLSTALTWIAWPLAYCAYILLRAHWSGFYPYPFVDLPEIGLTGLIRNVLTLGAVFIAIGLLLSLLASLLSNLTNKRPTSA